MFRLELIDTLWNVNSLERKDRSDRFRELIDTLWNVNISFICLSGTRDLRINRYIMECKCNGLFTGLYERKEN